MTAALITAVPFALVHMPLHFIGDFTISSLTAALITLLIVSALVRVLPGVALRAAANSHNRRSQRPETFDVSAAY
jgi:hypothetical protein